MISVQPWTGLTISAFSIGSALCVGGSVISILTQFLSNRLQHVMVDGCRSKLVDVVSGVRLCFGPVIVPPVHSGAFFDSGK